MKILVEETNNPTTTYYFGTRIQEFEVYGLDTVPVLTDATDVELVFVRYISSIWIKWLESNLDSISRIHFFMDDDLFDISAWQGLPIGYQLKLYRFSRRWRSWLVSHDAKLLVSTKFLAKKYASWRPELVEAKPFSYFSRDMIVVYYHGSSSHQKDFKFVFRVMRKVLADREDICFELIGDESINRRFRTLPRTVIHHPMRWPTYRVYNQHKYRSIGLAPLVETKFNASRSYTKFFDITSAGAIGLYARGGPFETVVKHRINGFLVSMKEEVWVDAIKELASSPRMRKEMLKEALDSLKAMT